MIASIVPAPDLTGATDGESAVPTKGFAETEVEKKRRIDIAANAPQRVRLFPD